MSVSELLNKIAETDPAAFCDADKSIRVITPSIRRINPGKQLLGIARTIRCFDDFLTIIEALDQSAPGEVLVVDTQGTQRAVVGELFSLEAARRGLAGIVIDGGCRDTETLNNLDLPVYARHSTPVSGTVQHLFDTQIPIICGGVAVEPGEIVFGDSDGLIVLSDNEAQTLLPQAQKIKATEQRVIQAISNGTSLIELTNFNEHAAAVRDGDINSRLTFRDDL